MAGRPSPLPGERWVVFGGSSVLLARTAEFCARIVLVADALDALTTDRPYWRARPLAAALVEMREHTGKQLCPTVMAALERVLREQPQVVGRRLQAVTALCAA